MPYRIYFYDPTIKPILVILATLGTNIAPVFHSTEMLPTKYQYRLNNAFRLGIFTVQSMHCRNVANKYIALNWKYFEWNINIAEIFVLYRKNWQWNGKIVLGTCSAIFSKCEYPNIWAIFNIEYAIKTQNKFIKQITAMLRDMPCGVLLKCYNRLVNQYWIFWLYWDLILSQIFIQRKYLYWWSIVFILSIFAI